ncbi:MAG: phosphopantetheine-binding protein [Armatimonadota bacterium]|jgi:acyl carrier protein
MTDDQLKGEIKELLVEVCFLDISPGDITDDGNLMDDPYNIESFNLLEISVHLEEKYDIAFAEEDLSLELFENVDSIAAYIKGKVAAEQAAS